MVWLLGQVGTLAELHSESNAAKSPFRFCRQCREQDLQIYGMTYWHREHHLPGVDICPIHEIALEQVLRTRAYYTPNPPPHLTGS